MKSEDFTCTDQFTNSSDNCKRQSKTKSHADSVKEGRKYLILGGIGFRSSKNDTVYNDQRDIQSQCIIQERNVGL